jgi:hypothetical protein
VGFDKSLKNTVHKAKKQSSQMHNGLPPKINMHSSTERRVYGASSPPNPVILDDDDSIEEVSPEPKRRYKGTAYHAPARQKASVRGSENKTGPERILATNEKSRFFPDSPRNGSNDHIGSAQSVPGGVHSGVLGILKRFTRPITNESKRTSSMIEDAQNLDDDSIDPLNPDHVFSRDFDGIETGAEPDKRSLPSHLSASKSTSISKQGDIQPSAFARLQFTQSQKKSLLNMASVATFDIAYIGGGSKVLSSDEALLQLRWNPETEEFDIISANNSLSDQWSTLVVKPRKIHQIKSHGESDKVIIYRATEQGIRSSRMLVVQMKKVSDCGIFARMIYERNESIKLQPETPLVSCP